MNIQDCNLKAFEKQLRSIAMKEKGIERLTQVVKWPDGKLAEDISPVFDAVCEFIVFDECVRRPFFEIVSTILSQRPGQLYKTLIKNVKRDEHPLTYAEAYRFLIQCSRSQFLDALECSSFTYEGILDAFNVPWSLFEKGTYDERLLRGIEMFKSALGNGDYREMMITLRKMKDIFLSFRSKDLLFVYDKPDITLKDLCKDYNLMSELFNTYPTFEAEDFISLWNKAMMAKSACERNKLFHRGSADALKDEQLQNLFNATSDDESYYREWLNDYKKLALNRIEKTKKLAGMIKNERDILLYCSNMPYLVITSALDFHKPPRKDDKLPPFERLVNKKNSGNRNHYAWIDLMGYGYMGYEYMDYSRFAKLGQGIFLYTKRMIDVYDEVKYIMNDEEKCILERILDSSKYTDIVRTLSRKTEEQKNNVNMLPPIAESDNSQNRENREEELNEEYSPALHFGMLCEDEIADRICNSFLFKFFEGGKEKALNIKYVFFGKGEKCERLVFTEEKGDLVKIIWYLNGKHGSKKIWQYFNTFIVDSKTNKEVFAQNPISNKRSSTLDVRAHLERILPENLHKDLP